MSVFRYDDEFDTNHFVVDTGAATVRIWETWMQRDARLFDRRYDLRGDSLLTLEGVLETDTVTLRLRRIR